MRQVFEDILDGDSALPGCPFQHRIHRISCFEAAVRGSPEGLLRIPVSSKLVLKGALQLLAKNIDPSPR